MTMLRTPGSTYRVQLHKDFTFDDAAKIAPYLQDLGVTHIYCSPYLQASPGSMHGYDVVDHQRVNDELGGRAAHGRFCRTLGDLGLGQILDIVPNHMSLGRENRYWWDVLENGTSSRYASFFDIDWQPQEERLRDKVLVPVLADQYGRVLQAGGIKVVRSGTTFLVEAASQSLPVSPRSLPVILSRAAGYAKSDTLNFLAASFGRLPEPELWDRWKILDRHRDKDVLMGLLQRLCAEEPGVCEAIDRSVNELNANLDGLDDFLNQQNYRLAYWKTADQQLGYRRFFDVNTLIGLRIEREHVFEETHALILDWLERRVLDGVRVDHPDGLRDPLEYFKRLRAAAPDAWIVGEKILEPGEFLRESWPIEGTSGYDFLNVANAVLMRHEGLLELNTIYGDFTGESTDFKLIAHDKKINVTQEALGSDVNRLTTIFVEICEDNRNERDYTRAEMRRALREVSACFQVYRTYVVPERGEITEEDRSHITQATECAKKNRQDIDGGLFDFLRDVLTMDVKGKRESEFLLRFQQFTSPVMAKGVEDTAFYCYNRLTGLNEVGSDPGEDGLTVEEFHAYNAKMQATHPLTMTTLSTHDTKRSDDVRARLAVLSEMPGKFGAAVQRWSRMNNSLKTNQMPDRNTEYFYYQTLIGAWPLTVERAQAYMAKATREAKQQTSWVANNKDFEEALNKFIESTISSPAFVEKLEQFVERVKAAGRANSLAQTLLKYTVPGVPDLYQGSELWDLSLVDPDNRRPVDYTERLNLLKELRTLSVPEAARLAVQRMDEGMPKLWTIHRALLLRKEHREWFSGDAAYVPLIVEGKSAQHAIAYLRGESVVTVVPRLSYTLNGAWQKTTVQLPEGRWKNRLTDAVLQGGTVAIETLLKDFPVALLTREVESDV
ncbi:malto-oligosyltrehalose synthase [Granulicella arctica]|uniref:malto-oligosyltrehalose synthase n=1 Tax=Granulicella arctica TaxID=940613 RepID=UPI00295B9441|nr:malto-oligosyltrehalose synthase [Granulicella arctica]